MNEKCRIEYDFFEKGAKLIILGLPEGSEFGMDLKCWTVGNKFKGLKMIPPGFHYYYFSIVDKHGGVAPRTGICHYFQEKEIVVKKYNPVEEDLIDESEEVITNIKESFKEIEIVLGSFPFECLTKWVSLTQHISYQELQRLVPEKGKICSMLQIVNEKCVGNAVSSDKSSPSYINGLKSIADQDLTHFNKDIATNEALQSEKEISSPSRSGIEIKFSKFPFKPYREGATPSEISRGSIDSSYTMSYLLQQLKSPSELLSEVQFSFISFLVGQDYESWEHWKKLIVAFCGAEKFLTENLNLYLDFLSIIHYQIQEVPEDLFVDIVENKNFLFVSLRNLFANIYDNKLLLSAKLISKAEKFQKHLVSKFHWDLNLEEDEEYLPVVVEI